MRSRAMEAPPAPPREAVEAAVAANPAWYHTLELPHGVLTPGQVDLRAVAAKILPADLRGRRALDVGTFDGFWAFELERRGAEVVAVDIDDVSQTHPPPNNRALVAQEAEMFGVRMGRGFAIAAQLSGSRVRRVACDVMALTPEAVGAPFDIAFMGALLLHLPDPVGALERVAAVLAPGGALYQLESVSRWLSILHARRPVARMQTLEASFTWWYPNRATLRAWCRTVGLVDVRGHGFHRPPQRRPMNDWYYALSSRRPAIR